MSAKHTRRSSCGGGRDDLSSEVPRRCAELLIHTSGPSGGGGGGGAWRWQRLNKMHEGRSHRPGVLLLHAGGDRQRVLVAGGGSITAEILQLSCSDPSDCGQWMQIAPLSTEFDSTFLVQCSNRIFAIGSFLANITPFLFKGLIITFILFNRLVLQCERTLNQCSWPAYCKRNFEKQDTIFRAISLIFSVFLPAGAC